MSILRSSLHTLVYVLSCSMHLPSWQTPVRMPSAQCPALTRTACTGWRLTEATTGLCAALTPTEKGTGYCIAQADGDVRALTKALNAALNGRGGGKPGICQGSCAAAPEQVEEFLREQNR